MKSTIRVDFDFDKNETFIQLNLAGKKDYHYMEDAPNLDLADKHLSAFVEQAMIRGIELSYSRDSNDNSMPKIALTNPPMIKYHSEFFRNWLSSQGLSWKALENGTLLATKVDLFELGKEWQSFIDNQSEVKNI